MTLRDSLADIGIGDDMPINVEFVSGVKMFCTKRELEQGIFKDVLDCKVVGYFANSFLLE